MSRLKLLEAALAGIERRLAAVESWHRRGKSPHVAPAELERARVRAGWTTRQAAQACGVAQSTWSRWENGEHPCGGDAALTVVAEFAAAGVEPPATVD